MIRMGRLIISCAFCALLTSGCTKTMTDEQLAMNNLKKIIRALDDDNKSGLKEMFAKNVINSIETVDSKIDELMTYYEGTMIEYTESSPSSYFDTNDGKKKRWHHMSNDITTSKNKYRLCLEWYVENTFDKDMIGITSLYIIKWDDNYDNASYYWGDGKYTYGINIGVSNEGIE